ncbi:Four and a half LIM domains protein 2 [Nymphon striatum]|nr:Four and a half LIM domains protein 2 [Nymphon striatum]
MADYDVTISTSEIKKKKKKTTTKKKEIITEEYTEDGSDYPISTTKTFEYVNDEPEELIFSGEYTKAMSKDWHSGHFCCWQCDETLTGQRYVLRDEHPYCTNCYEQVFANQCEECSKSIGIDSKFANDFWCSPIDGCPGQSDAVLRICHTKTNIGMKPAFLCNKCRVSLVDKPFGSKSEKVYCANCYDAAFATRCDGCGEIFRAGTKKMEYKGRQWHEKCFCCCVCRTTIGTKSFIPRENEIFCTGCYEDKFATRCIKCNKVSSAIITAK